MYALASKTRHFEKFKINISSRRIQTKFCTVIPKSSRDIQDFLDMKFRIFGQAVSKYMIVSVCVIF
jgi:hypothetical protein